MELIVVALATFTAVIFTLGMLPFRVPIRLMPVAVSGAGYGMAVAYQYYPAYVMAAAVAALVVLITRYAVHEQVGPWYVDDFLGWLVTKVPKPKPRHRRPGPPPRWNSVLDAPSGVGQRLPKL